MQQGQRIVHASYDRLQKVWQPLEGEKAPPLGVDKHELEFPLAVVQREGGDNRACQCRLARSRGACDQDVGYVGAGQPQQQRDSFLIEPEYCGVRRHGPGPTRTQSLAKGKDWHHLALRPRHLNFDLALMTMHATRRSPQAERYLLGQTGDFADLDAQRRRQVVPDQARCDGAARHPCGHLVAGEHHLNPVGLVV